MTLNVTVLTPVAIYQSSDFRLVDSSNGQMMSNRSPKSVELTFETWSGIATYTGLGGWDGRDVSQHIQGWLSGKPKLSMSEVAQIIATETTQLLDEVVRKSKLPRFAHTVTLVGFVEGRASVSVISNFDDGSGKAREAVEAAMRISTRQLQRGERARVLVTGASTAVARAERRAIKRLAEKHPSDGVRIRARLEQLNEQAAANEPQLISKDCAIASLRADGRGMLQLNRGGENPAWFPSVSTGGVAADELMRKALNQLGLDRGELQVVGYTRAMFRPGQEDLPPDPPCEPSIVTPDAAADYELVEIASEEAEVLYPGGQNEEGIVVGTARSEPNTAADIPWVWDGDGIGGLNFAGSAVAINGEREVVGMREPATGVLIANDGEIYELAHYHGTPGVFAGSGSEVRAINDRGEIAGSAHSAAEEEGHPNRRPALFRLNEPTLVAMDVPSGEGSNAVAINSDGLVLVWSSPAVFDSRAILWEPHQGTWRYAGLEPAKVIPQSLLEDGTVLGMMRGERDRQVTLLAPEGKPWRKVEIDERLVPVAMNNRGAIVGYGRLDGVERPWLRTSAGKMLWLPYLRYHANRPVAINTSGQIIGVATADHGNHVLVWRREKP